MALLERNFRGYLSVLTAICFAKYLNYISLIITLNIIMLKNLYIFSFQLMAFGVGDPPDRICLWQRNLASRNYTESKDVNKEVSLVLVCAQYFKIHQMIKNSWNHFSQNKILPKEAKEINLLLKIFSNWVMKKMSNCTFLQTLEHFVIFYEFICEGFYA